jgi:hypothetical protein
MSGEQGGVVTIVQRADHVLVSVPLVGFPSGFQVRPGERVVLVNERSGPAARPLVKTTIVNEAAREIVARGAVDIYGEPHVLQPSTVISDAAPGGEYGKRGCAVFVVDPGSAEGPKQVIAIRPV